MVAPRMRVALFGDDAAGHALGEAMRGAGHTLQPLIDLRQAAEFEAIIIGVTPSQLPRAVAAVEPYVNKGQIVIHTVLSQGVQALDDVEVKGAVVIAAAPVLPDRWVVTTHDELGETIASLILGEAGFLGFSKTDIERTKVAALVEYARMSRAVTDAAEERVARLVFAEESVPATGTPLIDSVVAGFGAIDEPGFRRAYLDAARRYGEVTKKYAFEMWAIQEDTR